eukprot:GILJ01021118.1.p1 GENE.GILJ01021118.1~~GILJ01021118.1.p1  ORF type:complete len:169 (-),score=32.57 GILJ01021118.1:28-534(-)
MWQRPLCFSSLFEQTEMKNIGLSLLFFCAVGHCLAQDFLSDDGRHLQAVVISNNAANAVGVGNTAVINSATSAVANGGFAGGFPVTGGIPFTTAGNTKKPTLQPVLIAEQPSGWFTLPFVPKPGTAIINNPAVDQIWAKIRPPVQPNIVVATKPTVATQVFAAPPPKK